MDIINSIKQLIFSQNDNKNPKEINKNKKISSSEYNVKDYYKYLFKSNYKRKNKSNNLSNSINLSYINFYKKKEEIHSDFKIKVNKCLKQEKPIVNSYIKDNNSHKKIFKKATLSPINKNKLQLKEEDNIGFFYILKGAIFIIEDWWKKVLIQKNKNKNLIKRNINSKNYELFSKKNSYQSKNNLEYYKNYLNININNIKSNHKPINKNQQNNINNKINNIIIYDKEFENKMNRGHFLNKNKDSKFNHDNSLNIKQKIILKDSYEENQKESYLEETLINGDSCFFEFTDNKRNESGAVNKEKEKINKIMEFDEEIRKRKIYSLDKIKNNNKNNIDNDNLETKRENSIIYPMNEIEHLVIEDICSNLDKHLKTNIEKEKNIKDYYNSKKIINKNKSKNNNKNINNDSLDNKNSNKDIDINKMSIAWEDPNNNMTPFISIEQNNELFNEIKSKIKVNLRNIKNENPNESELSIINKNYLLRENPLNDSSIYIKNSDIKQNELIRNVNIHIVPTKMKGVLNSKNFRNKILNNSNTSNTIQLEDEDYGFSELINISNCKNDDAQTSSFYNSVNKNENIEKDKKSKKTIINKLSKTKFENIYKN